MTPPSSTSASVTPPSWPCSCSSRCCSSRWRNGGCFAAGSSIEGGALRLARGGAGGGGRALRLLSVLLDGRHLAQDRPGDPAPAATGLSRPLDESRQLSGGLPA